MRRVLRFGALMMVLVAISSVSQAAKKTPPNPADYPVKVHVSGSRYPAPDSMYQVLMVEIGGRHYELTGATSSEKHPFYGNGLISPGDYLAKLSRDDHATSFESIQVYELLLPDGTTRLFNVTLQAE